MPDAKPTSLPFDEAIRFFRQKLNLPTRAWTDLWEGMHTRAFVVAGATRAALLEDFRKAVDKAISQGTTLAEFRKDFDQIVETHGWSYKGGRDWRSRVIFQTNLRTAYAAGRWQQIERVKERRPYLRYVAVKDDRTRPEHLAWHGTVLPVDDSWWKTHYPPNGWNCRCTVQQLSDRDLDRFGYKVNDDAPPVSWETRELNTPDGSVPIRVPEGIDTGFGYNVGETAGLGPDRLALERHGEFEALESPGASQRGPLPALPIDVTQTQLGAQVPPGNERALRDALRSAIGGDEVIATDPTGERVRLSQAIVDHILARSDRVAAHRERYFPFLRETIEDPAEIWVGFAKSKVTGAVRLRRRFIKVVQLGKRRGLGIVADQDGGHWSGATFFQGNMSGMKDLRSGVHAYLREIEQP